MTRPLPLLCLLTLGSFACGGPPHSRTPPGPGESPPPPPPPLQSADAWPFDFQWRQQVTATWPTGAHTFDAVLTHTKGELLLVGLSPLGLPGFVLRLDATGAVSVDNRSGRDLPVDPAYILSDVECVFLPWFGDQQAPHDGSRSMAFDGRRLVEEHAGGALQRRQFFGARDALQAEVRYEGWEPGKDAPKQALLDRPEAGYSLRIRTLTQARLEP